LGGRHALSLCFGKQPYRPVVAGPAVVARMAGEASIAPRAANDCVEIL
jgi:hypothetical protein